MTPYKTTSEIEKEFEEADFRIPDEASARVFAGHSELVDWERLKSFIHSIRQQDLEYFRGWAEAMKKEQLDKNDPDNYGACYAIGGFNDSLQKLLSHIKGLEK